jgi:hypothetical protein
MASKKRIPAQHVTVILAHVKKILTDVRIRWSTVRARVYMCFGCGDIQERHNPDTVCKITQQNFTGSSLIGGMMQGWKYAHKFHSILEV